MNTNIINLHNLSLEKEECMICKDHISSAQIYKLPECNHVYHTHCIVSWFRNGDSRCPYCGNKGINHMDCENSRNISRPWRFRRFQSFDVKISQLKTYAKKTKGPPQLIKELKKLEDANTLLKNRNNELKVFNEKIKTDPMIFSEVRKKKLKLRSNKWSAENNIFKIKQSICDLHIVPIIIPTPIDINS